MHMTLSAAQLALPHLRRRAVVDQSTFLVLVRLLVHPVDASSLVKTNRASLAHLLAAVLEVLAFELPRLVICLGEVIGVDKAIATPEAAERLLAAREPNRIVSGPRSRSGVRLLREIARKSHQRHEHDTGATTANEHHQRPPNRDHGLPLLAASQLVAEWFNACLALRTMPLAVLAFLVTRLGTVATAVVTSRSFFGENGVIGLDWRSFAVRRSPRECRARRWSTGGKNPRRVRDRRT